MEGRWRGGLALLTVAAICLTLSLASGCGDDGDDGIEPLVGATVTDSPAHTFAPVVYFHPRERYLPMSGKEFVARSTLIFGEDGDCANHVVAEGRRDLPRLTQEPTYSVRPWEDLGCRQPSKRSYGAEEITRPHENTDERVLGLRPEEGFYLDLDDDARSGAAATEFGGQVELHGAAAWYEERPERVDGQPGRRVTHWLLYGMHEPRRPNGKLVPTMTHEGDWERVEVLLRGSGRRWKPVEVRLFDRDGGSRDVPWADLQREAARNAAPGERGRTHPVLYAAKGTHTLYPRPGDRVLREVDLIGRPARTRDVTVARCRRCPRMETALPGFSLESQYWYGFGGGWGERGTTTLMTGPLGPRPPA